jgi:hypothetical protein
LELENASFRFDHGQEGRFRYFDLRLVWEPEQSGFALLPALWRVFD